MYKLSDGEQGRTYRIFGVGCLQINLRGGRSSSEPQIDSVVEGRRWFCCKN